MPFCDRRPLKNRDNNNYNTWRPGSNAAFGRNNGVPDLMRPSAANGVQGLMRPSAAKWHSSIFYNVNED